MVFLAIPVGVVDLAVKFARTGKREIRDSLEDAARELLLVCAGGAGAREAVPLHDAVQPRAQLVEAVFVQREEHVRHGVDDDARRLPADRLQPEVAASSHVSGENGFTPI